MDALSDDGRLGLTIIAFIGSVFSPYYAWARRRGAADPLNHCALNVALYGDGRSRWAMTERRRASVQRSADMLVIGSSALTWDGTAVVIHIDERSVPVPSSLRGVVRLYPITMFEDDFELDPSGHHRWRPMMPNARVEVDLERPAWRWRGSGYLDSNRGTSPLEDAFACWTWCRASVRSGAVILYDVERRDGTSLTLGLRAAGDGGLIPMEPPRLVHLPPSRWHIRRPVRATGADSRPAPTVVRTLEDTPFYARSLLNLAVLDEPALAVHESLSLDRFRQRWVQAMLPFRMPRALR
ncbi:MAG: carotenoid 1,2-hydratase [Rhodospirillales bacterium]|nr:carotenoid 1,2-hydratase [Rhodospirillales bacterium]